MLSLAGNLFGGIGLFLLGMWMMTHGLRLAAGKSLRRTIDNFTKSRFQGFATGVVLTASVQSSTAVTTATVGFVNAGLLTLSQAVWVIYGSNVGTTFTGWIVAATGLQVKLDSYALPLLGLAMLLRFSGGQTRRTHYGEALAGFAVFLLGVSVLKTNFAHMAADVDFSMLPSDGWRAVVVYFSIGAVLTAIIHSSSTTTALALTAASAGLLPVPLAALVIIGADLGTSSTAVIVSTTANAAARRVAASHVLFNLVTAGFAVAALPWLLSAVGIVTDLFGFAGNPGVTLALFSTTFNSIGVILMLPFTPAMVRFLERRFLTAADDMSRPKYLDPGLLNMPEQSLRNLILEVQRLGRSALQITADAARGGDQGSIDLAARAAAIDVLGDHIRDYIGKMNRANLPSDVADALAPLLRAMQHYEELSDLILAEPVPERLDLADLAGKRTELTAALAAMLDAADTGKTGFDLKTLKQAASVAEQVYEGLKSALLQAAAVGRIALPVMDDHMQQLGRLHRAMQRAVKAAQRIAPLREEAGVHKPVPSRRPGDSLPENAASSAE